MMNEIPLRITFNPHKHHFRFLLDEIKRWKTLEWEIVLNEILSIGNNLTDFYYGELPVKQICLETISYFTERGIDNKTLFLKWLNTSGYNKIQLSDNSLWLVKEGNDNDRYIHIHPAKFSEHTIRVRATTLKTAIALRIGGVKIKEKTNENLPAVNQIRKELLGLSPVKSLHSDTGILRLWKFFEEE
jgi:hypothetical protein